MKLSIVIPARNEEKQIGNTVNDLHTCLGREKIEHEILVIDDNSSDSTLSIVRKIGAEIPQVRVIFNQGPNGFGFAVRKGLEEYTGDAVAVFMADESDSPEDLVKFYRVMESTGVDCVFGSRFMRGSKIIDYPFPKLVLNRMANLFVQVLFRLKYNDITNAFKLYSRTTIDGVRPFLSHHFNLTVEIPLKAIVRGFRYKVVPNSWTNRKEGMSKFKVQEMGSRYLFIVFYCLIEKLFSRGDYRKPADEDAAIPAIRQKS